MKGDWIMKFEIKKGRLEKHRQVVADLLNGTVTEVIVGTRSAAYTIVQAVKRAGGKAGTRTVKGGFAVRGGVTE